MGAATLSGSDFVWLIDSLCHINRLLSDPALVLQHFRAPYSDQQCLEDLQALGSRRSERSREGCLQNALRNYCGSAERAMQMPIIDEGHT